MSNTQATAHVNTSHRMSATLRLIGHLARLGDERELVDAVVQAAAIWYDLDARAYRRTLADRFVLDTSLPGADPTAAPRDFSSYAVAPGTEVARVSSTAELERLGWPQLRGDLLLLPVGGAPSAKPRWIIAIRDWSEPGVDTSLLLLCRMLGMAIDQLTVTRARELQQRVLQAFVRGAESLEQQTTGVLEELANALPAGHARLSLRLQREGPPRVAALVGGEWPGGGARPGVDATGTVVSPTQITMPLAIGPESLALVELRPAAGDEFTVTHGMLGQASATMIGVWLAGITAQRGDAAGADELGLATSRFEARIDEEVERAKRFGLELGLVVADVAKAGSELAALLPVRKLTAQIRTPDLAGRLASGQLAVLLPHTGPEGVASATKRLAERFAELASTSGLPPVKLGNAAFPNDGSAGRDMVQAAITRLATAGWATGEPQPPTSEGA